VITTVAASSGRNCTGREPGCVQLGVIVEVRCRRGRLQCIDRRRRRQRCHARQRHPAQPRGGHALGGLAALRGRRQVLGTGGQGVGARKTAGAEAALDVGGQFPQCRLLRFGGGEVFFVRSHRPVADTSQQGNANR